MMKTTVKVLPSTPIGSKTIFPVDHTLIRKVILQDAKISKVTQEELKFLLDNFEDIMLSSSDIGYTKLIEVDTETNPNVPPIVSK